VELLNGCLGIARGDAKKELTKLLGLSHEEIAMYQSVISTTCDIRDLFGAWKAIWDKYDSKKPAMQSQLATELQIVFRCQMNRWGHKINEICARMVTDPGDDMKKAQVVKGVFDDFYSFAAQETRKVSSWSDFCASIGTSTNK
jgi:hypothetical protein